MEDKTPKYNSFAEWANAEHKAYESARAKGLFGKIAEITGWSLPRKKTNWTLQKCKEDALKYNTRGEWQLKSTNAYQAAFSKKWLDECCLHMPETKPRGYWNKERCLEDANKYNHQTIWNKESNTAYQTAYKNGWLEECLAHMEKTTPSGYWTKERCLEDAKKYNNVNEWVGGGVTSAQRNGWYDECTAHMGRKKVASNYWTKERCLESTNGYVHKSTWRNTNKGAYNAARINGWYDECLINVENNFRVYLELNKSIIIEVNKVNGKELKWTLQKCKEDALKYDTTAKWKKNGDSYYYAKKYGWLEECTSHMIISSYGHGYWTKERCLEEAKKYTTRTEWQKAKLSGYQKARKNKWLDECCSHMKN